MIAGSSAVFPSTAGQIILQYKLRMGNNYYYVLKHHNKLSARPFVSADTYCIGSMVRRSFHQWVNNILPRVFTSAPGREMFKSGPLWAELGFWCLPETRGLSVGSVSGEVVTRTFPRLSARYRMNNSHRVRRTYSPHWSRSPLLKWNMGLRLVHKNSIKSNILTYMRYIHEHYPLLS